MSSEKERNIKLPATSRDWNGLKWYIEEDPQPDFKHASVESHEAFRDMKFGVRIHWGLYSIWEFIHESWPFLTLSHAKKQEYQQLYKTWNPIGFNADGWMQFFKRSGFKCFAFTSKHHEGFSMFDTKTRVKKRVNWNSNGKARLEDCDLAYSIMETPFKRDVVKELCDAAHKNDIKIDLYFSHPDWYDADFRPYSHHPVWTWDSIIHPRIYDAHRIQLFLRKFIPSEPSADEWKRMMERHRAQLVELMSNYGKIDMCCLDMRLGPKNWEYLRETIKILRKIQPDVMFRNRGIGNYGDYYTPEGNVPGDPNNTNMPWMVIYPLGRSFSYEPLAEKHKGTKWIIHNLVDVCAKGGNFMVGIGPNGNGTYHPEAIKQCEDAGKWLQVNGEGIYGTRMWKYWKEGDIVRYTATKDKKYVYLFCLQWPGSTLSSRLVKPKDGSKIFMLGIQQSLNWKLNQNEMVVEIPNEIEQNKPCDYAWGFKIEVEQ
jgi:alpha-L-fucosidase